MQIRLRMFVEEVPPEFMNEVYKDRHLKDEDLDGPVDLKEPASLPMQRACEVEVVPRTGDSVWTSSIGTRAVEAVEWDICGVLANDFCTEVFLESYEIGQDPYLQFEDVGELYRELLDAGWEVDWNTYTF